MSSEIAEFLDACADDVSQDGHWVQGEMTDGKGGACALGIIGRQCEEFARRVQVNVYHPAKKLFVDVIGSGGFSIWNESIFTWNDEPERTQGEVADAFRTEAKFAREKAEKNV